jgi:zinc transport system ATP-binding protein
MPLADPTTLPLAAEDVSVEFGGLPVLRNVSIAVAAGEAVALLGGNGSGKSTLVRSLLGLVPARRGWIELFGQPLRSFTDWAAVGYVPQRSGVGLSGATVKEIVTSGRLAHRTPFVPPRSADRRAVSSALESVGLAGTANAEMAQLSGGQQQRVLIARALAGEPRLLLLDEPTAGVDLEHQDVLASVLADLIRSGTAVLVVLHELGALASVVHRAVVLQGGRVVHDGALEEVRGHQRHSGHEIEQPVGRRRLLDGTVER